MKKTTRLLALALALLLLLTACTEYSNQPFEQSRPRAERQLNISVSMGISEQAKSALRVFSARARELSQNTLAINLIYEDDPYLSLKNGETDIIYMTSGEFAAIEPSFAIFDTPFFFKNGTHASTALNSASFNSLVKDGLSASGLTCLGAVYGGAQYILSREKYLISEESLKGLTIGSTTDQWMSGVLNRLGAKPTRMEAGDRYEAFAAGELDAIICDTADVEVFIDSALDDVLVTPAYCTVSVEWMFVSKAYYASLSELQQAALYEAVAYLTATREESANSVYTDALAELDSRGWQETHTDTEAIRRRARELLYITPDFNAQVDWEFYDAVSAIVR